MRLVTALYDHAFPFSSFKIFQEAKVATVSTPDQLEPGDVLIVWGGEDIWPGLYNKQPSNFTGARNLSRRDMAEWELMKHAKTMKLPIIGICRGGQMLTALEGGYLYQHVSGHAGGSHAVKTFDNASFFVNSLHHQMMVPPEDKSKYDLIAWTPLHLSDRYIDEDNQSKDKPLVEPEFIYYRDIQGFAIQWHPEMMRGACPATEYVENFITTKLQGLV